MKKLMIVAALSFLTTGTVAATSDCESAIAGTLTGLPCCYESGGKRYSSTYGDDNKCKKPSGWYLCLQLLQNAVEGVA